MLRIEAADALATPGGDRLIIVDWYRNTDCAEKHVARCGKVQCEGARLIGTEAEVQRTGLERCLSRAQTPGIIERPLLRIELAHREHRRGKLDRNARLLTAVELEQSYDELIAPLGLLECCDPDPATVELQR